MANRKLKQIARYVSSLPLPNKVNGQVCYNKGCVCLYVLIGKLYIRSGSYFTYNRVQSMLSSSPRWSGSESEIQKCFLANRKLKQIARYVSSLPLPNKVNGQVCYNKGCVCLYVLIGKLYIRSGSYFTYNRVQSMLSSSPRWSGSESEIQKCFLVFRNIRMYK